MMKHSYSNDDTCFSIDVIDEILEEDFDALLDEGSEILHSIKGTILEEKLFAEFDEFMAMNIEENSEYESETEEPPFERIIFNADYKIKTSLEEPPSDLKLKPLPDHLEYVFLEEHTFLHQIRSNRIHLRDVLDEAANDDGTVELPKDFPVQGTPPSLELASLEDAEKTMVNGETRTIFAKRCWFCDLYAFLVIDGWVFSFGIWKCCMKFELEGVGGDDEVAFHLKC
ncbi:hypothetical protein Tco_0861117 [Tanacetum coccineum]|uniref:Reverse transcriptase domain-containing protein n=1 Tax=Tanacetum coccineum TaxID=301880 RepID=A0ABQ5BH02_9ASTR